MARYHKKPIVIGVVQVSHFDPHRVFDAVRFDPTDVHHSWPDGVLSWKEVGYQPRDGSWGYIETPTGKAHMQNGDWVITQDGKKYRCSHDVFSAAYELVKEDY